MCVLGINVVSFHNCSNLVFYCSHSVVIVVFLLEFATVPTVWCLLFFYCSLLLCPQCGVYCFSIGVCYRSHSVVFIVFLLEFATVPTVWCLLFFYWSLLLFPQCGVCCFSIGVCYCAHSVVFVVFLL